MSSLEQSENPGLRYFAAIPWCASILNDPEITVWHARPRRPNRLPNDDALFLDALNTPDAVPALITFYRNNQQQQQQQQQEPSAQSMSSPPPPPIPTAAIDKLEALVALGLDISGYPGVAHGGVVTAVLDEVLGAIVTLNRERRVVRGPFMTAYLNTTFIRPVKLPGVVRVTVSVVERDDRKMRLLGAMLDQGGAELARAEALFVQVRKGML